MLQEPLGAELACPECGKTFATGQQFLGHRTGKHGRRSPARRYADGSICRWRGLDFHTRPRLIRHLAFNSRYCLAALEGVVQPPLSEEVATEQDAADRVQRAAFKAQGRYKFWAERPPRPVPGARLRPDPELAEGTTPGAPEKESAPADEAVLEGERHRDGEPPGPGRPAHLLADHPGDGAGGAAQGAPTADLAGVPAAEWVLAHDLASLPTGPEAPIRRRWIIVAHLFSGPRRKPDV